MDKDGEQEYAALLPGGFYEVVSFEDIENLCVIPFNRNKTRAYLFQRFKEFYNYLITFNIPLEIWIDGSFLSTKEDPNDIDVVIQVEEHRFAQLSPSSQREWKKIFADKTATRSRWQVDAYTFFRGHQGRAIYWTNWYGHTRTGEEKGILRLLVHP